MKQCLRVQLLLALSLMLMIPAVSFAQSRITAGSQPAPYPTLKSTGNPESDRLQHEKAVKEWQETERLRNAQIKGSTASSPAQQNRLSEQERAAVAKPARVAPGQREIAFTDIPGYPKFIATGNPKTDEKNYQVAKAKWIQENPALYQKYLKEHRIKSDNVKRRSVTR